MRTWERTWPLPRGPTASASSPCTRTAASHEPQGAPGADRHRRPRDRAVPRTHPAAAAHHRQLGRPDRLPLVARARGGFGAPAGPRHRLGAGRVRAAREPVGGPRGCAGRRTDPAPAVRDRHRDGGGLSAGLRRLEPDPKAGRLRTRHARPWGASGGRDGGWDVGGPVRALGAGDPDRRLASPRRVENPGNSRSKGPGNGRCKGPGKAKQPEMPVAVPPSRKAPKPKPAPPARPAFIPTGVLIPPIDLLHPAPPEDGDAGLVQIEQMGRKLIETLQTFRVEGSIAGRTVGP